MTANRAILYCTVNGVCHNTNGLGRQTKTLLSALTRHGAELTRVVGGFDVPVACPQPGPGTWAFNPADLAFSQQVVASWGGLVHALRYETGVEFWSVATWQALSESGASCAVELARHYDELLVIAVDTPFAVLGEALARRKPPGTRCGVRVLLVYYSTALIVERPHPNPARVAWERRGIDSANAGADVWVGDVGRFLSSHLRATYVTAYTRELPRALCGLAQTRAVVCPSRGETLANVPFEVALWAQHAGPVVVAPRRDGFVEQIDDGVTGVLYDSSAPGGLTKAIRRALSIPEARRADMRAAAYERVRAERDVVRNLAETLAFFWPSRRATGEA